jgi:hypothetical protein
MEKVMTTSIMRTPPKRIAAELLRGATRSVARRWPIESWPGWLGTLHHLRVPANPEPCAIETPAGGSNARVIFRLLEPAIALDGDIAECGVFEGSMLLPIGLFVRQRGLAKQVLGFDSFEGLNETVSIDLTLGGEEDHRKRVGGFSNTSYDALLQKIRQFGLEGTVNLVRGYFSDTLSLQAERRFCFVHLDCVLYDSYRQCLEFFYPRVSPGGIVLLDEYNDPPWPGCTRAVDEFLADKPEKIEQTLSDHQIKYYFRKA